MKKEHLLIIITGFLLMAYLLDAVVDPLQLNLITPYHYFTQENLLVYPFTTVSIILKAAAAFLIPLLALSILDIKALGKGLTLIVLSALFQLYAVQDIATNTQIIPLEWSLALTLTGLLFIPPSLFYLLKGLFSALHFKLFGIPYHPPTPTDSDQKLHRLKTDDQNSNN